MRTALTISAVGHTVLLLWGVVTFVAKPHTVQSVESVAVDIISDKQFSQLTAGSRNAPKVEANAKPLVETVGERRPVDDPTGKIGKKEIADTTEKPPPAPTPKPLTPAENKPPEASEPKTSEPKRDLIAEAIRKDQAKKVEPKKAEAKAPTQAKRETPPKQEQPKKDPPPFDPGRIRQSLLDKREPQRLAATGEALNSTASLGASHGRAEQLSQNELDALRERLKKEWEYPTVFNNYNELTVRVILQLTKEGRVVGRVEMTSPYGYDRNPVFIATKETVRRAIAKAQPFDMLRPEHYELWKDMELNFDPREM